MRRYKKMRSDVFWLLVLILSLSACTQITHSNAAELFVLGQDFVHDDGSTQTINLICTVFEGLRCYFLPHEYSETYDHLYDPAIENEASAIDDELAEAIILDIDWKIVEHSLHNTVQIRCWRQNSAHNEIQCEYNQGDEWQGLPVNRRTG